MPNLIGTKSFKNNDVIFSEGAIEMCMYELLEGKVAIYTGYGKDDEKLLTEINSEEVAFFGEMGLIEAMPRSATAVSVGDTVVRIVDANNFNQFFSERQEDVLWIMQSMSKRIRGMTREYLDACRAVTELVNAAETGKKKSSWLSKTVGQFMKDYEKALMSAYSRDTDYYVVTKRGI